MASQWGPSDSVAISGAVAQLARAPALQAGGRGFDSHQLHSGSPLAWKSTHRPVNRISAAMSGGSFS